MREDIIRVGVDDIVVIIMTKGPYSVVNPAKKIGKNFLVAEGSVSHNEFMGQATNLVEEISRHQIPLLACSKIHTNLYRAGS